jgi:hypothetical protein
MAACHSKLLGPTFVDLDGALDELFRDSSALTRTLLGAEPVSANGDELGFPPGLVVPAEVREALRSPDVGREV